MRVILNCQRSLALSFFFFWPRCAACGKCTSLIRDQTFALYIGNTRVLTTGPPGKSFQYSYTMPSFQKTFLLEFDLNLPNKPCSESHLFSHQTDNNERSESLSRSAVPALSPLLSVCICSPTALGSGAQVGPPPSLSGKGPWWDHNRCGIRKGKA